MGRGGWRETSSTARLALRRGITGRPHPCLPSLSLPSPPVHRHCKQFSMNTPRGCVEWDLLTTLASPPPPPPPQNKSSCTPRGRLKWDLLTTLPFDAIVLGAMKTTCENELAQWLMLLGILKLVRWEGGAVGWEKCAGLCMHMHTGCAKFTRLACRVCTTAAVPALHAVRSVRAVHAVHASHALRAKHSICMLFCLSLCFNQHPQICLCSYAAWPPTPCKMCCTAIVLLSILAMHGGLAQTHCPVLPPPSPQGRMYRLFVMFRYFTYNLSLSLLIITMVRNLAYATYLLHW